VEGYAGDLLAETELRALLRRHPGAEPEDRVAAHDDIAVMAAVLRSRHPRHVKGFLNDLSLSLAVLRNVGRLGEGDEQLPARAVVVWHLLREAPEPAKWRELRALSQNLRGFLLQWVDAKAKRSSEEVGSAEGADTRPEGWDETLQRLNRSGDLDEQIAILGALTPKQIDVLVHTGSPPRELVRADSAVGGRGLGGDAPAGLGIVWIPIPAGKFMMGSDQGEENERPVHEVAVRAFAIARDPVTNVQYAACVRAKGVTPPEHSIDGVIPEGKAHHPVVHVSWEDTRAFCEWLNSESTGSGGTIGLPSEAQWEYAARGMEGRDYPWGPEAPDADRCNFGRKVGDTTPVGSYPKGATPEGVKDLAGNVFEWVEDGWHADYTGASTDGAARAEGSPDACRVIRGGSWSSSAGVCRSAFRFRGVPPILRYYEIGFRPARVQA
jgi:formylglycine-generating enzyme required for sulfatase activity